MAEAKKAEMERKYRKSERLCCLYRPYTRSPIEEDYSPSRIYSSDDEDEQEKPINIVTVATLLTNLIDEIDKSFSHQLYHILEMAIKMEREKLNSSEKLFKNDEILTFLQKIKIKLIDAVSDESIEFNRIARVKMAIKNLEILLSNAMKSNYDKFFNSAMEIAKETRFAVSKALAEIILNRKYVHAKPEELNEIVDDFLTQQLVNDVNMRKEELLKEQQKIDAEIHALTDENLKNYLRFFSDLSEAKKTRMMKYLERIYEIDERRVRTMIKYVDAGEDEVDESDDVEMVEECMEIG